MDHHQSGGGQYTIYFWCTGRHALEPFTDICIETSELLKE